MDALTLNVGNITNIASGFSIPKLLSNSVTKLQEWGGLLVILLGVVLIIWAVIQVVKAFLDQGRGQANWFSIVLMFLLGGAFMTGGWGFVEKLSSGGQATIEELGTGSAVYVSTVPADMETSFSR